MNPAYGTLADFRHLIAEAHRRGLRVITEVVANHTSDQHPWFQRARRAPPGSAARDFYVWSDTPDRYREARIIFRDFESSNWSWDPVANAYYWHRFYSHQPDLNFDNPAVRRAMTAVVDRWLDMGVDGLRLDAVPYLFEREGTSCENLPETHAFLKELRAHIDARFAGRMLLAEANQWPEDAVAYFGDGDECHMCFHFPLMPRLFMGLRLEDRFPIVDILDQTPAIPDTAQWGLFLRNHDELTLEMVTDEERDYMYRAYTMDPVARINLGIRRRLAPLLGNNRRRIELMNALLFSLPGTPFLYYGDEIGMGDNVYLGDRNGVRSPMQWSSDRNAGFSRADRQALFLPVIVDPEYSYESVNVEVQQRNPQSLLAWMRRLIALRKRHAAFGRGTFELLHPDDRKVLAFIRRFGDETLLIVANLSRFAQPTTLDLSDLAGATPVELFGRTPFPAITDAPYPLTLGPHSFYWFSLESAPAPERTSERRVHPLALGERWRDLARARPRRALEDAIPGWIRDRRWFGGKTRRIRAATIRDLVPLGSTSEAPYLALVDLTYSEGEPDTYVIPLARIPADRAQEIAARAPHALIAPIAGGDAHLVDAPADAAFGDALLAAIARRRRFRGEAGTLVAEPTKAFASLRGGSELHADLAQVEQSNSSLIFGERLMLKLFRRVAPGVDPELEIGRALTAAAFPNVPRTAGGLEYVPARGEATTIAVLQEYVPNEGDAWTRALEAFEEFASRAATRPAPPAPATGAHALRALSREDPPAEVASAIGPFLETAGLIGRRTAELHAALAGVDDPAFRPQPFGQLYQRSLSQSMHTLAARALEALRRAAPRMRDDHRDAARAAIGQSDAIDARFRALRARAIDCVRIRTHGDLHLGQLLVTSGLGSPDIVFIDFEGEPARSVSERRLVRPALVDVAGMLRSFAYAAESGLRAAGPANGLGEWARVWEAHVSARYLGAYLASAGKSAWVPQSDDDLAVLLDALLIEKAMYEVLYELNNRPDFVGVPLAALGRLL